MNDYYLAPPLTEAVRLSAHYDPDGRLTNVDITLENNGAISPEEIGQLVRLLARKGIPPVT